jgi:hypothetical protein
MHTRETLAKVFVLAALLLHEVPIGRGSQIVTVCTLLKKADQYNGRIVNVRGRLQSIALGIEDIYFDELSADDCSIDRTTPTKIKLESPDAHFLDNAPENYRADLRSIQRAERILRKELVAGSSKIVFDATVEGVFYMDFKTSATLSQSRRPTHRQYPGYLVIQAIRDLTRARK